MAANRNPFNTDPFSVRPNTLSGMIFGGADSDTPAGAAMPYFEQIPGMTYPYYKPYMEAGAGAIPTLQQQYGGLLNDPTALINKIAGNYQQSPYFQQRLAGVLSGGNRAAAARGYATAPRADIEGMDYANQLAASDFQDYMKNALSQYGLGLSGEQGLMQGGQTAGSDFAKMLAQALGAQGQLAFKGEEQNEANDASIWNTITQGIKSAAGLAGL